MAITPAAESLETDEATLALEGLKGKGEGEEEGDKGKGKGEEDKTKTPEQLEEEAAVAAKLERLTPIAKEDGSMETDAEAKTRVETEDAAAAEPTEAQKLAAEVKDLRQIIRTSKRDQVQMKAKIGRLEKRPVGTAEKEGEEEEEGEGETGEKKTPKEKEEEPLSRVEELQEAISTVGKERGASLDILLATMETSGAYKDVKDVCSRGNFDDIFETIATEASKDTGKDYDEVLLEVELNVWAKENPYLYMYDLIKKYHPSYAEQVAQPGEKDKKGKVIADAPGSISDKGGDGNVTTGWTAKRIDDLPEEELHTVPQDVYDKYMKDELK